MNRRDFLKAGSLLAVGGLTGCNTAGLHLRHVQAAQTGERKPNILFIMADDHTAQAIGAYGSRLAVLNPTPNIDELAREGMIFHNAFCTNSICVPSRANIMTGQHSHVNGCITLDERLPAQRQYLSIEMKKAGYQTAVVGKWHLGELPTTFDYYKVLPGQGDYFDPVFFETGATDTVVKQYAKRTGRFENAVQMKGHSSDCIADSALTWLKGRDRQKPFFLKLHFKAPHDMFEYAPRYEDYLANVKIPEPESMYENGHHGSIATRGYNDELTPYLNTSVGPRNVWRNYAGWAKDRSLPDHEVTSQAYQVYLKKYLRCVKGVDDNVKRVVDYLKGEGIFDDTVTIYTGDQGFYLGEHDYQDKRLGYEEGMRMPFIVRYPRTVRAGGRTEAIVQNIDYGPTMLDFAGVRTPEYMQGCSFRKILETGKEPKGWKQEAYYQYWMHMAHLYNPAHFGIRTKQYRLLFFYGRRVGTDVPTPPGWELYDLKHDPQEMNNVYDDPKYARVVKDLKTRLKKLRHEIGADDPSKASNDYVAQEIRVVNELVEEFWDYDEKDQAKAIEMSHTYLKAANERGREINF